MLRARIITAVILGIVFLSALFALPHAGWVLFTFVIALVAFWEWSNLAQFTGIKLKIFLGLSFFVSLSLLYFFSAGSNNPAAYEHQKAFSISASAVASLFWIGVAPLWLKFGWRPKSVWVLAITGWLVIFPTWFAMLELRSQGPWVLLALMALVWVADTAAYFTGRAFGRHKLAPTVSPGKTWEGVGGAVIGVLLYCMLCLGLIKYLGADPRQSGHLALWPLTLVAGLILLYLSVIGDLFESWMKRGAGMKDSSNLLPGHGGVLDRMDALTSTLPVAPLLLIILAWVANQ